ncbi:MAG: hypothetical protein ACYCUM_13005 [Solirubrobacteraceae bacterium]
MTESAWQVPQLAQAHAGEQTRRAERRTDAVRIGNSLSRSIAIPGGVMSGR